MTGKRMSKIHKKFQYVVEGGPYATFPIDMLRYDACYPANPAAVDGVAFDPGIRQMVGERKSRQVTLRSDREPTVGRWESFGWRVVRSEGIA